MLAPDHYPYGLDIESLNALAGRELDQFSLYQSCFLIWSADMEGPVVIDKPVSSLDILPTVSNLFDLPYDSRLMMGTDMLSDTSSPVIFQDHSWLTAFGCYNASTDHYTPSLSCGRISSATCGMMPDCGPPKSLWMKSLPPPPNPRQPHDPEGGIPLNEP